MNKLTTFSVFIVTILFSCLIIAQQVESLNINSKLSTQEVNKYEQKAKIVFKVIPELLDNKNQGVVESSIYLLILVKKYYPSADYTGIIEKLNEISAENPDPAIRIKAFLANVYLGSGNIVDVIPDHDTWEHDYIYKQITEQLENEWLASK